ncbi:MAG: helicase-related protein [Bacillota bacterium]
MPAFIKTTKDEARWEEAKKVAQEQGLSEEKDGDRYWAYVNGIYQRMAGKEETKKSRGLFLFGKNRLKKAVATVLRMDNVPFSKVIVLSVNPLRKAQIQSGERWITVHPSGEKSDKGIPVLIRESSSEPGVFHVIGGAGGKLNYLKLTDVKSPGEYKEKAKERAKEKKEEEKARIEREKEEGTYEEKQEGREDVKLKRRMAEREYIDTVFKAAGLDADEHDLDENKLRGMSEGAKKIAMFRYHQKLLKKAREMETEIKRQLMMDHEAQALIGLGDVPLRNTSDDEITYTDIDPDKAGTGLGYATKTKEKAHKNIEADLKPEKMEEEARRLGSRADDIISFAADEEDPKEKEKAAIIARTLREAKREIQDAQTLAKSGRNNEAAEKMIQAEKLQLKAERLEKMEPGSVVMSNAMQEKMQVMHSEVKAIKEAGMLKTPSGVEFAQPDMARAMEILKAGKKLKEVHRQVKDTLQEMEAGKVPLLGKAFAVDVSDVNLEDAVVKDLKEAMIADKARSFLETVEGTTKSKDLMDLSESEQEASLKRHLSNGTYNAINNLGLTVLKQSTIGRDVLDTLGTAGAAQLMARHIKNSLPREDQKAILTGVEEYHTSRHDELTEGAIAEAQAYLETAKEIGLGTAENPTDLMEAQRLNEQRKDAIWKAKEILGNTLGELEGTAALIMALKESPAQNIRVSMGNMNPKGVIRQARAIGLNKDNYNIESDGTNRYLTVNSSGLDHLLQPVDPEDVKIRDELQAIKSGARDKDGWLPDGIVSRPRTSFEDPAEKALVFEQPPDWAEKTGNSFTDSFDDYVGARLADGVSPRTLRDDMGSAEFISAFVPEAKKEEYWKAYENVFPSKEVEKEKERFDTLAEKYVKKYKLQDGDEKAAALNAQGIAITDETLDAVHRSLAKNPEGVVAFKPIGQLTTQDQAALRDYFWKSIVKKASPKEEAKDKRVQAKEQGKETALEPEETYKQYDIFGNLVDLSAEESKDITPEPKEKNEWELYVKAHGGVRGAYEAIQDFIRGGLMGNFAKEYGRIYGEPLKTGKKQIANFDRHLIGILPPEKVKEMLTDELKDKQSLFAKVAARGPGGKFTAGERKEIGEALLRAMKDQQQMVLFRQSGMPNTERVTIGDRAEKQLQSIFGQVSRNFKPGQPVKIIPEVSMSGKFKKQQRAVKAIGAAKRMGLFYGVGSGKSLISIGAFTDLHSKGKVKRAIYAVPSVVQGQFGSEMLRYTEPGKFRWFADPGASREQRMEAYRDPERHMVVVTHQALRDDLMHMIAQHQKISESEAATKLSKMTRTERKQVIKDALNHHGINWEMMVVDEGHDALNRKGKANSLLSNTVDALSDNTEYYMPMTGTPVKNDPSEAFDWLSKIDPAKYPHESRDAFLQKYGVNTTASQEALKREVDRYFYADRVPSGVKAFHKEQKVDLHPDQQADYQKVMDTFNRARVARSKGQLDVEAIKYLSPNSFQGLPEDQRKDIARKLAGSLGIIKEAALNRVVNYTPWEKNSKIQSLLKLAEEKRSAGEPGVVFAHNLESVREITKALKAAGHRVVSLTGGDSSEEKMKKRLAFNPDGGDPTADIIVASDAAATGINLQRGKWLWHHDTPDTAKTHEQRTARIDRLGQTSDVEIYDAVSNTAHEDRKRKRLKSKYALADVFQSPTEMLDDTGLAHFINKQRAVAAQAKVS